MLLVALLLVLGACTAEPQTIVETVVHEATVEVLQTVEVEVTRQVEATVEVTRQVEVTKEVPVEVTRIVEVVVTATPESSPTPTPTKTPAPTQVAQAAEAQAAEAPTDAPPASDVAGQLLQASYTLRASINGFRDGLAGGNCYEIVKHQDVFLASPSFDVAGTADEVQWAYGHYQEALALAKDAALGISQGCRDAIATQTRFSITGLNYHDIRGKLERALQALNPGIDTLESLAG